VTKLRLIIFLPSILVLWENKGSLAASIPQMHDNSQFPKFLVLDKPDGKKSLIEIVGKTGRKESVQKQAETIEDKDGRIMTDMGGLCSKDEDCPKGEVCHQPSLPLCGRPIKNAEPPKEVEISSNKNEGSGDGIADLSEPGHKSQNPKCVDDMPCLGAFKPVCGSDGKIYANECFLENAAACEDGKKDLVVASDGECSGASGARMMNG